MIKNIFRSVSCAAFVITVLAIGSGQVSAAKAGPAATVDPRTGNDISFPQCGKTLPTGQAFGIVGVNGGTAATTNECLSVQLQWAAKSANNNPNQPAVQVYVNTANPGEVLQQYSVTTWPTDNFDSRGTNTLDNPDLARKNPYGACIKTAGAYNEYTNSTACSWQYGWNRAVEAVDQRFAPAARVAGMSDKAADYKWWLDVETMNSWQTAGTPEAYARNTASLEGMKQFYVAEGVTKVGLYSTAYQWKQIVGNTLAGTSTGANLKGLESWLAGASSAADAKKRCSQSGLTGGPVIMNQYISRNLDYNYSCI
jgi:hypothetical protein